MVRQGLEKSWGEKLVQNKQMESYL
jgi:hypothetical protein